MSNGDKLIELIKKTFGNVQPCINAGDTVISVAFSTDLWNAEYKEAVKDAGKGKTKELETD